MLVEFEIPFIHFNDGSFVKLQDSKSVGALAGLALAIVFTWRLLRSPSGTQRRRPKRQSAPSSSSGASSHTNATITTSVNPSSDDSRAQNVIDEFFQPVKVGCAPHPISPPTRKNCV